MDDQVYKLGCRRLSNSKGNPGIYKLNRDKKKWERFSKATAESIALDNEGTLWAVNHGLLYS
jgi:hypothetical protein